MAKDTLATHFPTNKNTKELFDTSAGYAVFDTHKAVSLGVAAGFSRGVTVSKESNKRTYMNMGTGGVGLSLGIGGFKSQVVILFEKADGFETFVANGYDAAAEAGTIFGEYKSGQQVKFVNGCSIFVLNKKAWKVSTSAPGTKYWLDTDLN